MATSSSPPPNNNPMDPPAPSSSSTTSVITPENNEQQQQQQRPTEPETTVSLGAEEEVVSDLEVSPKQKTNVLESTSVRAEPASADEESSSADDSSYFADPIHLPKPKSSRHHATVPYQQQSDASLSFSEDSGDEQQQQQQNRWPSSRKQQQQQQRNLGVPELYPQRLTRVHSVSSLVSTSSHHSTEEEDVRGEPNHSGMTSHGGGGYPRGPLASASAWSSSQDLVYSGDSQLERSASDVVSTPQQRMVASSSSQQPVPPAPVTAPSHTATTTTSEKGFKVYWQRWIMLLYMSLLNLLSDWTCYSVAPIAVLTEEAFGHINAEQLVVIFLGANAVATACEPILLSRLGLRRTVLFGALLLMIGSIVKSGGMPPIIQANLTKGEGEWRVYVGFFLVGLSQPLYQCTPALLSASWFPEEERTMATGVALNANQLGIGFAFVFGTLLVADSDDIPRYFGLLSLVSTLTFLGTLIQFDDAPPTPPSDTARVMRGTLEVKLPSVQTIFESVRNIGSGRMAEHDRKRSTKKSSRVRSGDSSERRRMRRHRGETSSSRRSNKQSSAFSSTRKRGGSSSKPTTPTFPGPSPAQYGTATGLYRNTASHPLVAMAPSPMMPGSTPTPSGGSSPDQDEDRRREGSGPPQQQHAQHPYPPHMMYGMPPGGYYGGMPGMQPPPPGDHNPLFSGMPPDPQQQPFPPYGMYPYPPGFPGGQPYYAPPPPHNPYGGGGGYNPYAAPPPPDPYYQYYSYQGVPPPPHTREYAPIDELLPSAGPFDEGAEPVITITPHHMDIHIRDDQIWLSMRACLARPGFIHSLVSFTVSGIVINTLSTFMDYLVRLNGAGREYTGIVGGTFQCMIMISSLIIGKVCDTTRAYYSIAIGMLVVGAFGLAECGVSLDADRGSDMRWSLIVVAILVGPLQPVSTELGVDVVYPLSENTVLVIQQLFSNLLSAAFIPCFKAMRDIGIVAVEDGATERPEYTFSFYLLIVLHAMATVFFATFNGRYLRYEHELEKKAKEERRKRKAEGDRALYRVTKDSGSNEHSPLIPSAI